MSKSAGEKPNKRAEAAKPGQPATHAEAAKPDRPTTHGEAAALARYYDLDLEDDPGDLEMYLALAKRQGGSILELGAGSGRLAIPLAAAGYRVTAVDTDTAMLERAHSRWQSTRPRTGGRLTLHRGDATSLRLKERFRLAFIALNTLLLMGDQDRQRQALETLARHLEPDGLAVVDIWLPSPEDLALYDGRLILEWVRSDGETGEQVSKTASASYDPATTTVTLTQLFEAWPAGGGNLTRHARIDRLHLLTNAELTYLATAAGLGMERVVGDYLLTPFGPGSERSIYLGRLL